MKDIKDDFPVIADYICSKHRRKVYRYTWLSGSSTTVYPITMWSRNLTIQLADSCRQTTAEKMGRDLLEQFKDIFEDFIYCNSDGSCPKTLRVYLRKEYIND